MFYNISHMWNRQHLITTYNLQERLLENTLHMENMHNNAYDNFSLFLDRYRRPSSRSSAKNRKNPQKKSPRFSKKKKSETLVDSEEEIEGIMVIIIIIIRIIIINTYNSHGKIRKCGDTIRMA